MKQYQNKAIDACCPICGYTRGDLLYRVTVAQAAQHFVLKQAEPERFDALCRRIKELWGDATCAVIRCQQCEFVYSFPYVAGDEEFYALAFSGEGYPQWNWEFQITRDAIAQKFASGFKLLEVGAGNGAFVRKIAPQLIPKENVTCTEYSALGRTAIREYGLTALDTDVRALDSIRYARFFDVICMFQVLEHLDRLDELFAKLHALTTERASFFAAVPNAARMEFHELNGGLLEMPPNHIGRWNKTAFEKIAAKFGWRLKAHQISPLESFASDAKMFSINHYLECSLAPTSMANRIERIKPKRLRRIGQVFGVAGYALLMPRTLYSLHARKIGASQWVHLEKKPMPTVLD